MTGDRGRPSWSDMRYLFAAVAVVASLATGCAEECEEYGPDGWHPAPCIDEDVISHRVGMVATETAAGPFVAWFGEDFDVRGGSLGMDEQLADDGLDGFAGIAIAADDIGGVVVAGSAYQSSGQNVLRVDQIVTGASDIVGGIL